ncbi:hypothetical protein [Paraburkholderia sp. BL9I2N2]|uniref:hypothetical protein n=1 Tax=Paraburkholderia sp. BL9I2N2 TaxID=1938809 RepID=UPI001053E5E9|nr:hypothetical protein [Paraburkholderia sp. BL9I2N2]TCK87360.1 hypothetical protein B0G74_7899 [Paraburkholderia sp. BL9I2N2]
MYDFSGLGAGIDTEMGQNALTGQQIGYNLATAKDRIGATNAQNQAVQSNTGLQISNNQRQQAFQMESAALSGNPNATSADWQALAQKYPEFSAQVNANTNQQQVNWQNIRQRMSSDAVATVAGMQARLQASDVPGALQLLEARAVRQEGAGDTAGAAQTRSFEQLINQNPEGAKQLASQILNAGSANTAGELYANQANQAGAAVAQNTVPAKVAAANAGASLAGTQAAYAPQQAATGIQATQAGIAQTQANTGLINQQITAPPAAIAAAQPEYTASQGNQQLADQSGELAQAFSSIQNGGTSGLLGATWDQAGRRWTGDTSKLQQLRQEASSLVTQAETASMVNGNFTDASTARAVQNVPQITDSPQAWASYLQARQKFLASKAAWSNARGDWARGNNGSFGPAYRDMTVQMPNGQSAFVKQGDSFTQFSKKAAPSYYTAPGAQSFDPTQ